jgi:hypothetical protein
MMMKTKPLASAASSAAASPYDDMPLAIVLFRFLWPFWLFQDANRGNRFDRAAAYQHNRDMRIYLPGYLLKWVLSSALCLGITLGLDSLAAQMTAEPNLWAFMAAGCGMMFACGICILIRYISTST